MKPLLLMCLLCDAMLLSAQNLLPPVSDSWEVGRNADGISAFGIVERDGRPAFHVKVKADNAYTFYRSYGEFQPGDYTLSVEVTGESANGLAAEVYSFDKDGKPQLVMLTKTPIGVIGEPMWLHKTFTVPDDSAKLRVSVGLSGKGEGIFAQPILMAGRQPLPSGASKGPALSEAQSKWIADWIWLKDDSGVPRVDFKKTIDLAAEPTSAFVQLTADNAYELFVNGKSIGGDVDWRSVELHDIAAILHKGKNTLEVRVTNFDEGGGLLLQGLVLDAAGGRTEIQSDGTWEIVLPDGQPAALAVLGKVPMAPWGELSFHQVMPPTVCTPKFVEATSRIMAGEVLHYVFIAPDILLKKKVLELKFRFWDATGRETPLSAFNDFVRLVPETRKAYVELATSPYAMPGTYRGEIHGAGLVIPVGEVTILPSATPPPTGFKYPFPSLSNIFKINELETSLCTHSLYSSIEEEHYRSWAETGGHMYEVNLPAAHWTRQNMFASTECEGMLLKILENDPHAGIVLKFRLDTPSWWVATHPDDVFVSNNGRRVLQSFCSEAWRHDALEAICATVRELTARPAGQAIIGVLLMGFRGGEFQLWGEESGEYDCSPVAQEAFSKYLQENMLEKISLPHPALQFPLGPVDEEGAHVRDVYFRFVAERQADNLAYFIREFQRRFGTRYAIGMYFGYGLEYAGSNTRMLLAGHLGLERLLANAPPDFLSCPLSYSLRPFKKSHAFMFPVDSARLHGTIPIGENDVRNCLAPQSEDSSSPTIFSLADTIADNRRIRLFEAAHGAIVRYLALHPTVDWYFDHAIVRSIRQDNEFVKPLMANRIGDDSQVVMAANYLEWTKGWRLPETLFRTFAGNARDTLMRTGRAVSFLTFDDFLTSSQYYVAAVRKWKHALIPLPGLLTDSQKAALEAAYGPLPPINSDDGALLLKDGNWSVLNAAATAEDIWRAFATPEALAAGYDTIWYIGGNFTYSWNGKTLKLHAAPTKK